MNSPHQALILSKMKDTPYYQSLFSLHPLPSLILKPEGSAFKIVDVNRSFLNMLGKSKGELVGKTTEEECSENPGFKDAGYFISQASLKKCYASRKKDQVQFYRHVPSKNNGNLQERWYRVESIPFSENTGKVDIIYQTIEDITESINKQKSEQRLQEELLAVRQQLRHFVDFNPDGLYSLDITGKFTSANEGLIKLAEVAKEELLNMTFLPFCADEEEVIQFFRTALAGEAVTFESNFVSAKGRKMILRISLSPNIIENRIAGVYGIAKDITEVRESEKVILEKKRFLEVNASFIRSLLENELEDEALKEAFAIIGKTVAVDRMYYFGADKDPVSSETYISQKIEWTSLETTPQIDNQEMQGMPASKVRQIMGPLNKNLPFIGRISELEEGDLKDLFLEQDIKSMLLLPIFLKNELYGFIGFDDCTHERKWTNDEIDFLQSLAHYFTNALEKKSAETTVLQKEEELKKSEQKFKALVQEGSDLIAIVDIDGNFQFVSNTATIVMGESPEKLVGANAFSYVHPEDKERLQIELADLEIKRQKKSSPYRFKNHEGNWRWIETAATNLLDDPAVNGIVLNSRDITTIVEQAREIEQINNRYQLAAAATNDLMYDWDLVNNQITRFHSGAKDLFGYTEKELDDQNFWLENVHPDERDKETAKLNEALRDKTRNTIKTEYRFKRADGTYAKVTDRGYILRDSEGKAVRIIGATSDVSDLAEKEEALILANTRFELAMKATDEIIWDWDIKNDLVTRSAVFEKNYGYDSTGPVNSFWFKKVIKKDRQRVQNSLTSTLEDVTQSKWREEYCLQKANGEQAHVIDRGYIVRDKKGHATRVVGALLDVTESRRLIKEIRRQNEGLREIAWKQSHEVRAPLARLKGLIDLLRTGDFIDLDQNEILSHILCSADELDKIIREIVAKTEKIEIDHPETNPVLDTSPGPRELL